MTRLTLAAPVAPVLAEARRRWRRTMAAIGRTEATMTQLPVASTAPAGLVELAGAQLDAVAGAGSMRQMVEFGVRTRPDAFGVKVQGDAF
jgi:hypothetical protein